MWCAGFSAVIRENKDNFIQNSMSVDVYTSKANQPTKYGQQL